MICSALGLSGATGLNAWLPLVLTGVFERIGWIDLAPGWEGLGSTTALVILGLLLVADVIGDKIPVIDHGLHAIGMVVAPVAGAVVFDAQAGTNLPTAVNLIAGGTTAGLLHTARAGARPTISGVTGGLGAPLISLLEDFASLLLVVVAFALPIVAGLAVLALIAAGFVAIRHLRRLLSRRRAAHEPVPEPYDLRLPTGHQTMTRKSVVATEIQPIVVLRRSFGSWAEKWAQRDRYSAHRCLAVVVLGVGLRNGPSVTVFQPIVVLRWSFWVLG